MGYRAVVDPKVLGLAFEALVFVTMKQEDRATLLGFEEPVERIPNVLLAQRLFGDPDYLLRVRTTDLDAYARLEDDVLATLPGVQRLNSPLVMKNVVIDRPPLPVIPIMAKTLTVFGIGGNGGRGQYERSLELVRSGRVDLDPLVTHRFSLDQIEEAFATAAAKSGGAIKVVVSPALDCAHGGTPAAASNVRPLPMSARSVRAKSHGRTAVRASHSAHYGAGLRCSGGLPPEV